MKLNIIENRTLVIPLVILFLITGCMGFSQGFVNLGFESARIIPLTQGAAFPPYSVATTNAVPGWTVYYGAAQQSQITYNDPALGSTFVTLYATNGQQIAGNFSVLLQGGGTATDASISQTALTPVTAESILFKAEYNNGVPEGGLLLVSMNGQNIPFFSISTGLNYTLYGGDISAFAGQTALLTFSAPRLSHDNNWNIDDIVFSSQAAPEPGTFGLFGLGCCFLGLLRFRRK
jgi:hypothetical protein